VPAAHNSDVGHRRNSVALQLYFENLRKAMTNAQSERENFSLLPALIIADVFALIGIGLSAAELFPEHGVPLGLIPSNLTWPVFLVSIVVAAVCGYFQIKIVLARQKTGSFQSDERFIK
jgi:hypothetical protein